MKRGSLACASGRPVGVGGERSEGPPPSGNPHRDLLIERVFPASIVAWDPSRRPAVSRLVLSPAFTSHGLPRRHRPDRAKGLGSLAISLAWLRRARCEARRRSGNAGPPTDCWVLSRADLTRGPRHPGVLGELAEIGCQRARVPSRVSGSSRQSGPMPMRSHGGRERSRTRKVRLGALPRGTAHGGSSHLPVGAHGCCASSTTRRIASRGRGPRRAHRNASSSWSRSENPTRTVEIPGTARANRSASSSGPS